MCIWQLSYQTSKSANKSNPWLSKIPKQSS